MEPPVHSLTNEMPFLSERSPFNLQYNCEMFEENSSHNGNTLHIKLLWKIKELNIKPLL